MKHIILIMSIVIIFYIFYTQYNLRSTQKEMFTDDSNNCEDTICQNEYNDAKNLPLREYCVKSSFNSAYNGSDVSEQTLKDRVLEGYRLIDLNVYSADNEIYVGYSPDNSPAVISNKLLLSTALNAINETAFTNPDTKKPTGKLTDVHLYPLFVHIRVYRKQDSDVDVISKVAKIINGLEGESPPSYSANYLRTDNSPTRINGCTKLSELMGKLIFSMDILNILENYASANLPKEAVHSALSVPKNTIKSIQSFVNVLTGGSTFPAFYNYTEESIINRTNKLGITNESINGSFKTNVKYMYIIFPHPNDMPKNDNSKFPLSGVKQPDTHSFLLNRSIQYTPLRVYLEDANLKPYTDIFDYIGTPFAPMMLVYAHLKSNAK